LKAIPVLLALDNKWLYSKRKDRKKGQQHGSQRIVKPGMEFHRIAKENMINVVGATHYSIQKYACMAMVDYFTGLGIEAEYIEGKPCMKDL
jgi:hypothetical protein